MTATSKKKQKTKKTDSRIYLIPTNGEKAGLQIATHLALDGVLDVLAGDLAIGVEGGSELTVASRAQDAVKRLLVRAQLLHASL